MVIERGTTLEMCPTSNWLTRGVARVHDHPAHRLLRQGVGVTLNTDDTTVSDITLSEEYQLAPEQSTDAIVVHHPEAKYFNAR